MIDGCAHANGEGSSSGGDPEGDLVFLSKQACILEGNYSYQIGQGIKFLSHKG